MNPSPLLSHPDRELSRHLDDVDRIAARILARHQPHAFASLGLDVGRVLSALAGWHDVGKATAFFQDYIADPVDFARRHARGAPRAAPSLKAHTPVGSLLALRHWSEKARPMDVGAPTFDPRLLGLLMALVVRGHHTRLPSQQKLWETLANPDLPEQMASLPATVESC